MAEIIFLVEEAPEGGYAARANKAYALSQLYQPVEVRGVLFGISRRTEQLVARGNLDTSNESLI
jgi:hypothetical protein